MKFFKIDYWKALLKRNLAEYLQRTLGKVLGTYNQSEQQSRIQSVRVFLHETLPHLDPAFVGRTIIEGGRYNYFKLPDGTLPLIDFALTELPLYVCVPGIESASWPEARSRGVSRPEWERVQANLAVIETAIPHIPAMAREVRPRLMMVKWNDSVNHHSLLRMLKEVLTADGIQPSK